MTTSNTSTDKASIWLFGFSFLLLWEWLRPLEQLTNTGNIEIFLFFIVICFLLYLVKVGFWIRFFTKSVYLIIALHALYFDDPFFALSWVSPFLVEIVQNIVIVFKTDWLELSNLFRTLLFFLLLGIIAYLLRYWVMVRRKIFIFFFMTIIYITVLDTFTSYQANWAIVRTVIAGFMIMGILTYYRQMEKNGMVAEKISVSKWIAPLVSLIVLCIAVGFMVPKPDPIWADPVPFLKSYSEKSGAGINRAGYGTDDTRLGGAFIGDNQVVFQAEVESRQYWKVETKDVYTGKGWITSSSNDQMIPFSQNEVVPVSRFSEAVETVQEKATITQLLKYSHIVYPNGLTGISASPTTSFEMHPVTEKIYSINITKQITLDEYLLTYEVPKYSVKALINSTDLAPFSENDAFMQQYTQLPVSLPPRVRELALDITAEKNTWYEKAIAIENYFDRPEYVYEKTDVMIPGEEDDYVDQFLFDSKQGYCDNFSSSMVVLLRTLGIPSRWVKGYSEGDFIRLAENSKRVFEVTNNNAHSWVEVYFNNVGWVPFEPTKGFANNVIFNDDTDSSTQPVSQPILVEQPTIKEQPTKTSANEKKLVGARAFSLKEIWSWGKGLVSQKLKWISVIFIFIVLIAILIYGFRLKWIPSYLIWKYKRGKQEQHFAQAYLELLKQFNRHGLKRKEGQTLREYARIVDGHYKTHEMGRLTARYEQLIYKGSLPEGSWQELKESWENLIKKTIA